MGLKKLTDAAKSDGVEVLAEGFFSTGDCFDCERGDWVKSFEVKVGELMIIEYYTCINPVCPNFTSAYLAYRKKLVSA